MSTNPHALLRLSCHACGKPYYFHPADASVTEIDSGLCSGCENEVYELERSLAGGELPGNPMAEGKPVEKEPEPQTKWYEGLWPKNWRKE